MTDAEWASLLAMSGFLAFVLVLAYGAVLLLERADRRTRRANSGPASTKNSSDYSGDGGAGVSAASVAAASGDGGGSDGGGGGGD